MRFDLIHPLKMMQYLPKCYKIALDDDGTVTRSRSDYRDAVKLLQ
jgi:hypothetical protein